MSNSVIILAIGGVCNVLQALYFEALIQYTKHKKHKK